MQLFKAVFLFLCGCGVIDSIPTAFLWPWVVFRNEYEFRLRRFRSRSFFLYLLSFKKRKSKMFAQRCAWLYLAFFSQILQSYASKAAFNHLWFAAEIALKWFILNFVECADKRIHVPKPSCTIISIVLWLFFFQIFNHAHSITFSGWIAFHTFKCALYLNSEISSGPEDAGLRLKLI